LPTLGFKIVGRIGGGRGHTTKVKVLACLGP
jgi:hypothetical protein